MKPRRHAKWSLRSPARLARDEDGNLMVEFGLIAPILVMFVFGILEFGRVLWTLNALHYSVQEAARCASVNSTLCGSATQIATFAADRAGANFSSSAFTATVVACGNQVTGTQAVRLNIPFTQHSVTVSAQSCYPI